MNAKYMWTFLSYIGAHFSNDGHRRSADVTGADATYFYLVSAHCRILILTFSCGSDWSLYLLYYVGILSGGQILSLGLLTTINVIKLDDIRSRTCSLPQADTVDKLN